jgi:hypothetical protein
MIACFIETFRRGWENGGGVGDALDRAGYKDTLVNKDLPDTTN